ncbi:MAG: tyrosine-protein phosphatase [Hydrogenophaga sp.]|uniref:tyrosine-protein phosphatase n=1 Tax=Hydrogenophaga sp. TaxID=1904254 RepID=UPI002635E4AB|nr:tyrosine-protein phosphatase [Hydrogenophaga sp.]MDM7944598.1 tyrosine-protein phosphatase [Hydrogenophaga sp.]
MKTDRSNIVVALDGASNFRDLGGLATSHGPLVRRALVYRSDHLARLSAADHHRLLALRVTHCVDLRGHLEREVTSYHLPGAEQEHLAIEPTVLVRLRELRARDLHPGRLEAVDIMRDTYRAFVQQQGPVFGRLLRRIGAHDEAMVFHCTAGKDRTGMAAALLLELLGVHRDDVMEDYLLTNHLYKRDHQLVEEAPAEVLDVLWKVQPDFLNAAWRCIDDEFGGVQNYLRGPVGLSSAGVQRLHDKLLGD